MTYLLKKSYNKQIKIKSIYNKFMNKIIKFEITKINFRGDEFEEIFGYYIGYIVDFLCNSYRYDEWFNSCV